MDRQLLVEALRRHPLLRMLSEEQLGRFADAGELEAYDPGETVVSEGSIGDAIYLILAGRAEVHKAGTGSRRLADLEAGDFFGEMCLVETATRSATVIAGQRSELFRLPNREVHRLAEQDPLAMNTVLAAVIRTLSERLRRMNDTVAMVGQLSDWLKGSLV